MMQTVNIFYFDRTSKLTAHLNNAKPEHFHPTVGLISGLKLALNKIIILSLMPSGF